MLLKCTSVSLKHRIGEGELECAEVFTFQVSSILKSCDVNRFTIFIYKNLFTKLFTLEKLQNSRIAEHVDNPQRIPLT